MKIKTLFLVVLLSYYSFKSFSSDSTLDARVKEVQKKISDQDNRLKATNDSLSRELLFYKVKEDYYSTALSDQSNKYIMITTILFAIASLISWAGFNIEVNRVKGEFKSQIAKVQKEMIDSQKKLRDQEYGLMSATVAVSIVMGAEAEEKGKLVPAFRTFISSAKNCSMALIFAIKNPDIRNETEIEVVYKCMELSKRVLKKIVADEKYKAELNEIKTTILEDISEIMKLKDEFLLKLCAEVVTDINTFLA